MNANNESEIFNLFPENKEDEDEEVSVQNEEKKSVSHRTISSTKEEMEEN